MLRWVSVSCAVLLSACLSPVDDQVKHADGGAQLDAGQPQDAGTPDFVGTVRDSCGPTDGPAEALLIFTSALTCDAVAPNGALQLDWALDAPPPGTYALASTPALSVSRCGAQECRVATEGTLTITTWDVTGEVTGVLHVRFDSAWVDGTFRLTRCPSQRLCG
jgi:hypothetical protein